MTERPRSRRDLDELLNAELDGELEGESATDRVAEAARSEGKSPESVDTLRDELRVMDTRLRGLFGEERTAGESWAVGLAEKLPKPTPRGTNRIRRFLPWALATAAGILLAALWFGSDDFRRVIVGGSKRSTPKDESPPDRSGPIEDDPALRGRAERAIGRYAQGSGPIAFSPRRSKRSYPLSIGEIVARGDEVRTEAGDLARVSLENGSEAYLDGGTSVAIDGHDAFRFTSGRLLVELSPTLKENPKRTKLDPSPAQPTVHIALELGSVQLAAEADDAEPAAVEVRTTKEGVEVIAIRGIARVKPTGKVRSKIEELELRAGDVGCLSPEWGVAPREVVDPVVATAWRHPLLDDLDLRPHLERLVVLATRTKARIDGFENAIRRSGTRGARVLASVVIKSPALAADQRRYASRLVADLAGIDSIPSLLEFLWSDVPGVRASGQRALIRLTGQRFGGSPDDWARTDAKSKSARERATKEWYGWWEGNRGDFSP